MIYVNDKRIEETPYASFYKTSVSELKKKYPKTIVLKRNKKAAIYDMYDGKDGTPIGRRAGDDPHYMIPLKCVKAIGDEGYSNTWTYSKSSAKIKDEQVVLEGDARRLDIQGSLPVDMNKNADLAFYLYFISPYIENGTFYVQDYEKEAEVELASIGANSDLDFFLTSENSPISSDREALITIARSWGIENADDLGDAKLKLSIRNTVLASEANKEVTKRGIKDFAQETKIGHIVKWRAMTQQLVDEKKVAYDLKERGWFYMINGIRQELIINATDPTKALELLHKHVRENPNTCQKFKVILKGEEDASSEFAEEDFKNLPDISDIKDQLKAKGINTVGKKNSALQEEFLRMRKLESV